MAKKRILILGAGLAGLSTAWHLQRKGIDCSLFEKEREVGGLCRSKQIDGFTFDCDGHLLHFRHRYGFNLVKSLLKDNLAGHERSAWIYAFDRYIRYPFQANLYGLPSAVAKECLVGFIQTLKAHHPPKKPNANFLDWINLTFGQGLARHFFIPYNRKFWTIPPRELTCEWLDGFIPVPSLTQILEGTLEESQRQFGYNARFWYPKDGGINRLPLALAGSLKNIYTDSPVTEIDLSKKEITTSSGERLAFDCLVSTIPLPELARLIKEMPGQAHSLFRKLKWNSILNLNLGIERNDLSGKHWIYFPQKETCFFRVGFFHNFSSSLAPRDRSSLYVEVSYSAGNPINKENISLRIRDDLRKVGLLSSDERIATHYTNDIKYGYPIYDKNYRLARDGIFAYLSRYNIIPCGRYGSWRYMSMEDVLLDGKRTADSLSHRR